MGDEYLNGRVAADFEQAAIRDGRRCEQEPVSRPVTDLGLLP